jgi:hypothetical protein
LWRVEEIASQPRELFACSLLEGSRRCAVLQATALPKDSVIEQQNPGKTVIVATETRPRAMPSTAIRSLFYDSAKSELRVTFVSGRRYVYADVPAEVFEAFNTAESRGTFFNHEIRDRYDYREIRRRSDAYRE